MKAKNLAAGLLALALASCALAYQFVNAAENGMHAWRPSQDVQLQSLDSRIADKVREFQELSELLSGQLAQSRPAQGREQNTPLLVGPQAESPAAAPAAPARQVESRPARQSPWWSKYRLSMIVFSDDNRSAVINGRYVRRGDRLAPGVIVQQIAREAVVLSHNDQTARLTMRGGR